MYQILIALRRISQRWDRDPTLKVKNNYIYFTTATYSLKVENLEWMLSVIKNSQFELPHAEFYSIKRIEQGLLILYNATI